MLRTLIASAVILAVAAAGAAADEIGRPDPLAQVVVSSVSAATNSIQLLINAYEQQRAALAQERARLAWYEAYFRGLKAPAQ